MMVDDLNKKGGLLGKKVEAVVVDPASNWPLFAEKARDLFVQGQGRGSVRLLDLGVAQIGTAGLRGAQRPAVLSRPVRGRGELEERLLYRRRAEPAGDPGGRVPDGRGRRLVKRWVLEGTDYVYPRTTNKILEAFLKSKGVAAEDIMINYTPFGHSDWQTDVAAIKNFASAGKKTAVVSTINGDANVPFYKELANAGHQGLRHPGRRLLGRRRGAGRHRHQEPGRPSRRLELLPVGQEPDQRGLHQAVARLHQEPEARDQRSDGSPLHRLQDVGPCRRAGRHDRCRRGAAGDVRAEGARRRAALSR